MAADRMPPRRPSLWSCPTDGCGQRRSDRIAPHVSAGRGDSVTQVCPFASADQDGGSEGAPLCEVGVRFVSDSEDSAQDDFRILPQSGKPSMVTARLDGIEWPSDERHGSAIAAAALLEECSRQLSVFDELPDVVDQRMGDPGGPQQLDPLPARPFRDHGRHRGVLRHAVLAASELSLESRVGEQLLVACGPTKTLVHPVVSDSNLDPAPVGRLVCTVRRAAPW